MGIQNFDNSNFSAILGDLRNRNSTAINGYFSVRKLFLYFVVSKFSMNMGFCHSFISIFIAGRFTEVYTQGTVCTQFAREALTVGTGF